MRGLSVKGYRAPAVKMSNYSFLAEVSLGDSSFQDANLDDQPIFLLIFKNKLKTQLWSTFKKQYV